MTSLIQQRFALDRRRVWATCIIVVGVGLAFGNAVLVIWDPSRLWPWLSLAVWAGSAVVGVVELLGYRKALRAFESEHGVGAGRQD